MRGNPAKFWAIPCLLALLVLLSCPAIRAEGLSGQVAPAQMVLWGEMVGGGWEMGVRKRVLPRLEVGFASQGERLFEPEVRIDLVENLHPVRTVFAVAPAWVSFYTQLRLGPVHAVVGGRWGTLPLRWGAVCVAGSPVMALSAGWRDPGGLSAEVRIRVASKILWDFSLFFRDGSVGMGVATWR